ncbi:hypothetical protein [Staphylococcus gallinarum]
MIVYRCIEKGQHALTCRPNEPVKKTVACI